MSLQWLIRRQDRGAIHLENPEPTQLWLDALSEFLECYIPFQLASIIDCNAWRIYCSKYANAIQSRNIFGAFRITEQANICNRWWRLIEHFQTGLIDSLGFSFEGTKQLRGPTCWFRIREVVQCLPNPPKLVLFSTSGTSAAKRLFHADYFGQHYECQFDQQRLLA